MAQKERLDQLLVKRNYFQNRSKAKRVIMTGQVFVNNQMIDKAGTRVDESSEITIKGEQMPFVSRGGLKLEKALKVFAINPKGKEVIDIGASTGGFTDCLLQNKANKVYAVDVGYGQLAWKLRKDERVCILERTNFRYLTQEELPVKVPLIVTDVSFISLRLIIPAALNFLEDNGDIVALIKPQFEAGHERIGKNGIVKEKFVHIDVLKEISLFFAERGLFLVDLDFSPITGANSKNIEFLIHLKLNKRENNFSLWNSKIEEVVKLAHQFFGGR